MKFYQQLLTNNDCYKAGKKITIKGLMLHSTGVNNPNLRRYIGPDDGNLGTPSSGHWNQPKPGGRSVCVHAFIGLDKNGEVKTYQTLPWAHRGWHAGGKANDTHIGVEICEGNLDDAKYFHAVYKEAVDLFAHLCNFYKLTEKDIITHSEGYKMGIASNHADVMHWFPKHGKSMDTFRADVKAKLGTVNATVEQPKSAPIVAAVQKTAQKSIDELAQEVIKGLHGGGDARKKSLGANYDAVQARVNDILNGKPAKTISQLADEVIKGLHGSGRDRMLSLGSNYAAVQAEVTRRMRK